MTGLIMTSNVVDTINDLVKSGLFPNPITLLAQLLATLFLFYILKNWIWIPMNEFLQKRQEVIIDELESARSAREQAENIHEEYKENLKNAKIEANYILENARIQGLETKDDIINKAEKEAAYKIEKAEKEIETERAKIEAELKAHVVEIALTAAEKLVKEVLDNKKNRQLIDQFIEEVGE